MNKRIDSRGFILPIGRIPAHPAHEHELTSIGGGHHHQRRNPRRRRTPREYFKTLKKASDASNDILREHNSPYYFEVLRRGKSVFIVVWKKDRAGAPRNVYEKDITDDDFNRWIEDVATLEGLIIDTTA